MKLKIKMLKNLISVLCAATIATSGVVTSVSAVKTAGNTSSTSKTKKEEVKQIANEFANVSCDFSMWAVENNIDQNSSIYQTINEVYRAYVDLGDNFDDAEKVNKYKILVTESIKKLEDFKKNHKKEEVKQTSNEFAKTNEKLDKESEAGKIQAAEKIQAAWRGYNYRKNAKEFDEVAGEQYEEKLNQYNNKYLEVKSLLDKTTHKKRASLEAEVKLISEKIIAEQAAIRSDLERIQKEFDVERVKSFLVLLDEATNKLNSIANFLRAVEIYNAFSNYNLALARWVVANNLHKDNPAYEDIKKDAKKVHDVYAAVVKDFDNEKKVNEFKTLANKTSQKMREFKENNTKAQSEVEKLHGKFEKEANDFLGWAMENGIDLKVYDPKSRQMVFPPKGRVLEFIMEKGIKTARLVYEQIGNDFSDAQKVDLYKRLVEGTTKSMKTFKEDYEKRQNELINRIG